MSGTRKLKVEVVGDGSKNRVFSDTEKRAESMGSKLATIGKKIGPVVAGGVLAVTAAVGAGLFAAHGAATESLKIARESDRVVRSTAGVANVSAGHIADFSSSLSQLAGVDDELIQGGANLLTTFTNIRNEVGKGNDIWDQGVAIALDMATVMGTDMKAATIQVGKALNDPIKGITALTRAGVSFTEQQKEQVRALTESGDRLGAQKIILAELRKEFGGAAEAAATPLDRLKVAVGNIQEEIGGYLIPVVDDAATFIGARLPEAMAWASDTVDRFQPRLEGLRDWLGDVGNEVWDTVVPAWDDLVDTGQNVWSILQQIGGDAAPLVKLLGGLGGAAVLGGIRGLAASLEMTSGFLARNEGVLRVLMAAVVAFAAVKAWGVIVGVVETIYIRWLLLQSAVTGSSILGGLRMISAGFFTMGTNSQLGAGMVKGGLQQIASSAAVTNMAVFGVSLAVVATVQSIASAQAAARAWRSEVEQDIDTRSVSSYMDAVREAERVATEADAATRGLTDGSVWARWTGSMRLGVETLTPLPNTLMDAAAKEKEATRAAQEWATEVSELKAKYTDVAAALGVGGESVERWARALDLDPNAMGVQEMATAIGDAKMRAEEGTPATDDLAEAYGTLSDETASATDQLDAWKQAMDAVMGVHIGYEQALIGYRDGLAELAGSQLEAIASGKDWAATLDINTQMGRDNRKEISGLASDAIDMAMAFGRAEGGVDGATQKLMAARNELIEAGVAAGLGRTEMEGYLTTLGMTPDEIRTALELEGIATAERQINHTTRPRVVRVGSSIDMNPVQNAINYFTGSTTFAVKFRAFFPEGLPTLPHFARGGPIRGGVPGVDSVPILAMPDEFMWSREAAKAIGMGNLARWNENPELLKAALAGSTSSVRSAPSERVPVAVPVSAGASSSGPQVVFERGAIVVQGSVISDRDLVEAVRKGLLDMQQKSTRPILPGVS